MYKENQKVELNGKMYIISKCSYPSGYKACGFCQSVNIKPPCIDRFDYSESSEVFDLRKCKENMPEMCIPKVFSKSS
jgi:hypothetical protein